MQPEFWQQRWAENQIGFHQATPTPLLLRHFQPRSEMRGGRRRPLRRPR